MIDKARLFETDDELGPHEVPASILNLRCKACERENFYRISEMQDIPGTPISFSTRKSSYTLMRSQNRLSRAANTWAARDPLKDTHPRRAYQYSPMARPTHNHSARVLVQPDGVCCMPSSFAWRWLPDRVR